MVNKENRANSVWKLFERKLQFKNLKKVHKIKQVRVRGSQSGEYVYK